MRVLTTTLCYPTPADPQQGIFVQRRARAVAEHDGVDLTVVAPQLWCPVLRRHHAQRSECPDNVTYPPMLSAPVLGWLTDGLAFARVLRRVITRQAAAGSPPPDLIDAHFVYPDGVGAWLTGRRFGIPVVVTVRGKIIRMSRRAVQRLQIATMLRRVDARIAVSTDLARWVHRVGGRDLHVEVIPNGVDPIAFHLVDRDRARALLNWDPRARHILAVGHLSHYKGFDRILSALPVVRDALGDVRLVLVGSRRGERWFRREVHRLMARIEPPQAVTFTDPVPPDALNLMYNAADLTVNASRNEGWCNAIVESLATGTPVVATNVGGNAEQINVPELGIVVPDGGDDALARALIAGLSGPWDHRLIADHGSARIWPHVADEVLAVFRRVLASRGAESRTGAAHGHADATAATPAPAGEVPT